MATQAHAEKTASHPNKGDSLKVWNAKVTATYRTIRLLAMIHGTVGLIGAGVLTLILCFLFHLDPLMAFAGSFVGCVIVCLSLIPIKPIWLSKFTCVCQERKLYELADKLAYEGIEGSVQEILAGRKPREETPELRLKLSQLQLLYIRKGELRTAMKIAEYMVSTADSPYHDNTIATMYVEVGRFEDGIRILRSSQVGLNMEGRGNSPVAVTTYLGLISAELSLRRFSAAEGSLQKLKEVLDGDQECQQSTDRLVRIEVAKREIDTAFYLYLLGKLQTLTGDESAESNLTAALKIMEKESNRRAVQLLPPEIKLSLAELALAKGQFEKAKTEAEQALRVYETESRYRGIDYHKSRAIVAYSKFRQGLESATDQLKDALKGMSTQLEDNHPDLATHMFRLAESQIKESDIPSAIANLQRAYEIRNALFGANDQLTLEAKNMLAITSGDSQIS
ncbi:MAG: tetratricopeptide repeat protein [Candidatus Obscuribacterales bacterium]|nr:tetratricopeptide repeat protein [Candidatus Obscuribacterales bacterium]